jgi:hypothetical protein
MKPVESTGLKANFGVLTQELPHCSQFSAMNASFTSLRTFAHFYSSGIQWTDVPREQYSILYSSIHRGKEKEENTLVGFSLGSSLVTVPCFFKVEQEKDTKVPIVVSGTGLGVCIHCATSFKSLRVDKYDNHASKLLSM